MNTTPDQQISQESEYEYPYHYIPTWNEYTFSQTKVLGWGYEYLSYLNFVTDKVSDIGFRSLLDVGCGTGRFLFDLRKKFPDKKLVGIDYYKRAIDFAQIMATDVEWRCGDIRDKNIVDTEFDIITLIETLEHIHPEEVKSFLQRVHHYLAQNGSFIMTVPSTNVSVTKKHFQHFDIHTLEDALCPFFSVVEVTYLNRNAWLSLHLIEGLLANRFFILNNRTMLKMIYRYYLNHLLLTDSNRCRRILAVCKKLSSNGCGGRAL